MDLHFRQVTSSDYDDVINIRRGIYQGMDYLASRFHSMMETHEGFVAMDGDNMVGFAFVTTIDDGTTFVTRAARVHKDYEGKGVYRSLSDYISKIYSSNLDLKRRSILLHSDVDADHMLKKGAVLVGKRAVKVFQGKASHVLPHITDVMENNPLHPDALSKIFKCSELCSVLFPSDRIVSSWVAYRLLPSNIKYFNSHLHRVIATSVDPENVSGRPLLSVGVLSGIDAGEQLHIDFHGDIGEGSKIREHMKKHLKLSLGPQTEDIAIAVSCEAKMDVKLLCKMMEEFSLTLTDIGGSMILIEENM